MPRLVVINGPDRGLVMELSDQSITVGHHELRDLRLKDDRVSRMHARIHREGPETTLVDLSSSNGTFLNGALVKSAPLHHGDLIVMGKTCLQYEDPEELHAHPERFPVAEPVPSHYVDAAAATVILEGSTVGTIVTKASAAEVPSCDIVPVVQAVAEDARPLAARRQLTIRVNAPAAAKSPVDANALYQVLAALLSTAIEHLPKAQSSGEMNFTVSAEAVVGIVATSSEPREMRRALSRATGRKDLSQACAALKEAGGAFTIVAEEAQGNEVAAVTLPATGR